MTTASKRLLWKALKCLANEYDEADDCFFVVITKDGKNPTQDVGDQMIIGEINIKTLVAFMLEATRQVCASVEMEPHVFISRYITGALLEQERSGFHGFGVDLREDPPEDEMTDEEIDAEIEEEDEDEDEVRGVFVLDPKMTGNIN